MQGEFLRRRTFLKGLFLTAVTGTLTASELPLSLITPAQALAHDASRVEIYWYAPLANPARVVLTDQNDHDGFLRGFVREQLDFLNSVALEPHDELLRHNVLQVVRARLHEARMYRRIYDMRVVMDDSNHTAAMMERGAKNVDVWIKPIRLVGFFQMRFGFDPEVSYGYTS